MDTEKLELLLDVVRMGSFAEPARVRGLSPSSVSRALAAIEAELDVRLLHRTTRKLTLTEAGERYVDRVESLVAGLSDAAAFARDTVAEPAGTVRATVPVSFGLRCIVPNLPELYSAHPGIQLDLVMSDARLDLLDARVDFAVRLGRLEDSSLVARRLFRMTYRVVASPAYVQAHGTPTEPYDLERHPCLLFPLRATGPVWRFRDGKEQTEVSVGGPLLVSNTVALRDAAISGLGVTVLPQWLVGDALADGRLVPLLEHWEVTLSTFDASAWLLFPTRRYVPARVRAVADFLSSRLSPALDADGPECRTPSAGTALGDSR